MLWHIFGLFVLMNHSLLAAVGMIVNHESLRGDQAVGYLFVTKMFSSCFVVVYFQLQDHSV